MAKNLTDSAPSNAAANAEIARLQQDIQALTAEVSELRSHSPTDKLLARGIEEFLGYLEPLRTYALNHVPLDNGDAADLRKEILDHLKPLQAFALNHAKLSAWQAAQLNDLRQALARPDWRGSSQTNTGTLPVAKS